jgi:hypothetical protein
VKANNVPTLTNSPEIGRKDPRPHFQKCPKAPALLFDFRQLRGIAAMRCDGRRHALAFQTGLENAGIS